jgi:hypothetical protein
MNVGFSLWIIRQSDLPNEYVNANVSLATY